MNESETSESKTVTCPTDKTAPKYSKQQQIKIMLPLLIGGFIALLNETILNVAFPQLMSSLNVPLTTIQWLGTAYMLIIGISVPVTAFLIKTFSTRTLYLSAMTIFMAGTVFCGISNDFPSLLVSRVLQGCGTGMLLPIMMDTIMEIFPLSKRGTAMGVCMMIVVAAPGIGPTISGFVLQYLNWHWLFFIILPFAVLSIFLGVLFLKSYSELTKPKIDILSIILSTIGFGGLIFGISAIETMGFGNVTVFVSLICGIVGLFLFARRQLSLPQPMLNIRIFRYPMFTLGTILLFLSFMMPFAVNIILPTYMQEVLKTTTSAAGLALLPGSIVNIIVVPVIGRLYDKIGAKPLVVTGFAAMATCMFFLSRITATSTLGLLIAMQVLMTFGIALIITPAQTNSLNQLSPKDMAHGVAILNTTQQIAAAFGSSLFIGLMGVVSARNLAHVQEVDIAQQINATVTGANTAFMAAFICVSIGLVLSFFMMKPRKADTHNRF
ncbi:MAG: MDR family MFS transporter [Bacteroidales bacterium]|jgi:MFS transporter, DHA2 family, lincomycin resistance protein|nr:DHA2 family efflux MFS transporter permease subunit [Bacteroidales bacterium]MDD2205008.1 MDR family MFS transporter [Bacteroidales bacterium]MDD3153092.1 MDR family MFS transporter [Bacteroidales bacterium]MDD3914486.1 MDR family MFS transporter [Bacteroidales bacterium]MDD4634415.1 MDR family MFS transporter [Bacteroidales bacterium]